MVARALTLSGSVYVVFFRGTMVHMAIERKLGARSVLRQIHPGRKLASTTRVTVLSSSEGPSTPQPNGVNEKEQRSARQLLDAFVVGRALALESSRAASNLVNSALSKASELASEVQSASESLESNALTRAEADLARSASVPLQQPVQEDEEESVQAAVDKLRASAARARLEITRRQSR